MAYAASPFKLIGSRSISTLEIPKHHQKPRSSVIVVNSVNGAVSTARAVKKLKVAYQGVPGAYSEFAAKTASPDCNPFPCRAFEDAISAVEAGKADLAVLPVESTMEGTALRNYDLLLQHDISIVQEINLFVKYCLLAMPGVTKSELKRVISHPMALAHSGRALTQLGLDLQPVEDTAGAVELLLSNKMLDTAAIASSEAAVLYGLNVLADGVQDESWNVTRFLILSKDKKTPKLSRFGYKTSMVVGHDNESLTVVLKVLSAFSSRNISLTKLEVNPLRHNGPVKILDTATTTTTGDGKLIKEFPCVLYVDFEGSMDDQKVKDAIADINQSPVFVRILGSYSSDPNIYGLN